MTKKKALIELKDVWKTYHIGSGDLDILKGVNLDIPEGDFVAILGPSGSGKSTLMNQVGILDIPSKGEVYLKGEAISRLSESEVAEIRGKTIGFIFQQFNLIPTLTALENVSMPAMFQGVDQDVRDKRAEELLTMVGLKDRLHHRPTELSGGQQQRVAIARALINDPEIILADEPTGNLDSVSGKQVIEMITKLHGEKKKTIILITHDHSLVTYANRVVYIKDGNIQKITQKKRSKHTS